MGMRGGAALLWALAALVPWAGCATPDDKPKDLGALRLHLLRKAKQKYEHSLRITERHSPDPFSQARMQLVYVLIELEDFGEAERLGREFVKQKFEYLEAARTRLAEVEIDWKKARLADPRFEGTRKDKAFEDAAEEWKGRIRSTESQVVGMSLLLGEVLLRRRRYTDAIPVLKPILEIAPDHNTALRRLGQSFAMDAQHTLAAGYLEKAAAGMEARIRALRGDLPDPDLEEPGEAPPPAEEPSEETSVSTARAVTKEEQIERLERAFIETACVTGTLYFLSGEVPRAEDWFAKAFEFDPTSDFLELKLGLTLLREGRKSEGAKHLAAFEGLLPKDGAPLIRALVDRVKERHLGGTK